MPTLLSARQQLPRSIMPANTCILYLIFAVLCPIAGCPRPQELDQGPLGPRQGGAQPLSSFSTAVCVSVESGDRSLLSPTCPTRGQEHGVPYLLMEACLLGLSHTLHFIHPLSAGQVFAFCLGGKGASLSPPPPRPLFSKCVVFLASGMAAYLFLLLLFSAL